MVVEKVCYWSRKQNFLFLFVLLERNGRFRGNFSYFSTIMEAERVHFNAPYSYCLNGCYLRIFINVFEVVADH